MDNHPTASEATARATILVCFPIRNGYVYKVWPVLKVTTTQIVAHNPDHVLGAKTRFRRSDGLMVGEYLPHLNWRVSVAALKAINECNPEPVVPARDGGPK